MFMNMEIPVTNSRISAPMKLFSYLGVLRTFMNQLRNIDDVEDLQIPKRHAATHLVDNARTPWQPKALRQLGR